MNALHKSIGQTRNHVDFLFGKWALLIIRMRWIIVIGTLICVGLLSPQLAKLRIESTVEGMLTKNDPKRVTYENFRHQFGHDERMLLLVDSESGVFDLNFLKKLQTLHQQIENEVSQIQNVDSLINARNTRGVNDQLIVQDLMEDFPETATELEAIRQQVLDSPRIRSLFLNEQMSSTLIMIRTDTYSSQAGIENGNPTDVIEEIAVYNNISDGFEDSEEMAETPKEVSSTAPKSTQLEGLSDQVTQWINSIRTKKKVTFITTEENERIINELRNVIAQYDSPGFRVQLGGGPVVNEHIGTLMLNDLKKIVGISLGLIIVLLAVIFRRIDVCFLPPIVALLSVITTLAVMALADIPISLTVQMTPTFILAIGVANSVHIFTSFFQATDRGNTKIDAIKHAMEHTGLPITMTGLTTAGGLLSFAFTDIQPIIDFGIITPVGIICALLYTLVFLPALMAILPLKEGALRDTSQSPMQRSLRWCGDFSTHHPYLVTAAWSVAVVVALIFATQCKVGHNSMEWFPDEDMLPKLTQRFDKEFGGSMFLEVVLDTQEENALHNPALLNKIDELQRYALSIRTEQLAVGKTISIIDVNKEIHQALNNNDSTEYRIPQDRQLIAQELLLFENAGSEDLEQLVDSQFSKARITMTVPFIDGSYFPPFIDDIEQKSNQIFEGHAKVTLTGLMALIGQVINALISSMINSYIIAIMVIAPLMMLLLGSVRTGLLSMIPNLAPIIITLGAMGLLGIRIDLFTLLIGSIALGLAVDDTIHFMHNYQRCYLSGMSSAESVQETLRTTGAALSFTTIILATSFMVYTTATMKNLLTFGYLISFCIVVALLADIMLAPALMTIRSRYQQRQGATTGLPNECITGER